MENTNENTDLACTLNDTEFRERKALARKIILPQIVEYRRIQNGLHIQFTNSEKPIADIKEFIQLEQGCCGFLNFELIHPSTSSNDPVYLIITGPEGATKFIDVFVKLVEEQTNAKKAA